MPSLYMIGVLFSLTAGEWVTVMAAIFGTGLIGQVIAGSEAVRRLRKEKRQEPVIMRTVAAEEAESAVRILGVTIEQQHREIQGIRTELATCEQRWRDHVNLCPLWGVRRGSR